MVYKAKADRLERMAYHNAGRTGLKLPAVSLGLWHQFGDAYPAENVTKEAVTKARRLNELAKERGQSLPQMALAWLLKDDRVTSVLIGASRKQQIEENVQVLHAPIFSREELSMIEAVLNEKNEGE
ncbi:hypothetical protein BHT94_10735 [Bacillus licheniformis]|nr:hypothetical protein BHT94_10735 [Bacillus licheniformis]